MPTKDRIQASRQAAVRVMRQYNARKDAGLCTKCGLRPPEQGRAKCAECLARCRADRGEYRQWLIARGLCILCRKKMPAGSTAQYCPECAATKALKRRIRREQQQRDRVCIDCGKPNPNGHYKRCEQCQENYWIARAADKRTGTGRCTKCGRFNPPGDNHATCPACRERLRTDSRKRYEKRVQERRCITCNEAMPSYDKRTRCRLCRLQYSKTNVWRTP